MKHLSRLVARCHWLNRIPMPVCTNHTKVNGNHLRKWRGKESINSSQIRTLHQDITILKKPIIRFDTNQLLTDRVAQKDIIRSWMITLTLEHTNHTKITISEIYHRKWHGRANTSSNQIPIRHQDSTIPTRMSQRVVLQGTRSLKKVVPKVQKMWVLAPVNTMAT